MSDQIAHNLGLSDELLDETLQSGADKFHDQVAWAHQHLVWEGLVDASRFSTWVLMETERNAHLSDEDAREIVMRWVAIHAETRKQRRDDAITIQDLAPPSSPQAGLAETADLLSTLQSLSPSGFERMCREFLRESGFENVEVIGGSADGGIDGYGILPLHQLVSFIGIVLCKRDAKDNLVACAGRRLLQHDAWPCRPGHHDPHFRLQPCGRHARVQSCGHCTD